MLKHYRTHPRYSTAPAAADPVAPVAPCLRPRTHEIGAVRTLTRNLHSPTFRLTARAAQRGASRKMVFVPKSRPPYPEPRVATSDGRR
jgi:hypothetical protein